MRKRVGLLGVTLAALAAGCGGEAAVGDCNDGVDNDGDLLIDEADPSCTFTQGMNEFLDPPPMRCDNGMDDDADGLTDFPDDPGCAGPDDDDETDPPPPPPECNDAVDNNGNGVMDFPSDPGCVSLEDEDEDDDPTITECFDGIDNDGDGLVDYPADLGCTSASDQFEFTSEPGACGPSLVVSPFPGSGMASADRAGPSPNELQSLDCGGLGGEFVWTYEMASSAAMVVTTNHPGTTLDTVVYVREECRISSTELGCDDDDPPSHSSTLVLPRVEPGSYYIIVDTFGPGSLGHVDVTIELRVAHGDPCDPMMADVCAPGLVCRPLLPGDPPTCEFHACADELDNDSDGDTDYPDDAGCADEDDDTELIPPGDPIPACGNGVDDDGDGLVDFEGGDPGCVAASDPVELDGCMPGQSVEPFPVTGVTGTTVGGLMLNSGTCDPDSAMSSERVHAFVVTDDLMTLSFSTEGSSFANVLYVRAGDCAGGPQVACASNDSGAELEQSVTIAAPVTGETYFVFVDGDWASAGSYSLSVSGTIPGGGDCDPASAQFVCTLGYSCDGGTLTCVPATCNNGADDDGDGLTDWPNDPGCIDASDGVETDPAILPDCGDGADNDGDGFTDFAGGDPGCEAASDGSEQDSCIPGVEVLDLPETGTTGDTTGGSMSFQASCFPDSSFAPERVHAFTVDRVLTRVTFSTEGTGTAFDDVLYVRQGVCDVGPDVACANASFAPGETVEILSPALDTYFVFVDGNWTGQGAYELNVSGVIAGGESCDPTSTAFLCVGGTVCRPATSLCQPTLCNDGLDSDGDTLIDEADPGCASILDDDETDPPVPPQCADGIDNDADGFTDYSGGDPGCAQASDNLEEDCLDSDPIVDVSHMQTYTGTTATATNDHVPSCSPASTAKDVVHRFTVPGHLDSLQIDTNSSPYDTVVYLKFGGCDEVDYACDDDSGTPDSESLILQSDVAAGTYFIVVDGWNTSSGTYNLHITGTITAGAACDPLQVTAGFLSCAAGTSCTGGVCI
jgi:hypothetical protein